MSEFANPMFSLQYLALFFFPALLLSLWLTPIAIRYSGSLNAIDYPDERKIHDRPISRLGGVAIVAGLFATLLVFGKMDRTMAAFLAGAFLVATTGFLDDLYHIPPAAKFFGEVLGAAAFVLLSGVRVEEFGDLFGTGAMHAGALAPAITIFCMVGVMNALNLSDGLDGLAGGIGAIACLFLGTLAYLGQQSFPLFVLLALLGASFGFLRYNTYPANLFMGDTGSLLLGYTLSAACVVLVQSKGPGPHLSPVTVAGVLALPVLDTLMVMARRLSRGENPFLPDKTHLHHRLLDMGFPHAAVVSILYVSSAAFGAQAWILRGRPDNVQFLAVLLLGFGIYVTVHLLQRAGFRWKRGEENKGGRPTRSSAYPVIARLMEKSVVQAGWVIGIGIVGPVLALPSIPRPHGVFALAAGIFVAALFPWRSKASRSSVSCGLMYLSCLFLLAILQLAPEAPNWFPGYLAVLSALVMGWVLLKMKYYGHQEIIRISSFEMLLIGVSIFVPLVLVPALKLGDGFRRTLLTVSLEATAFLLAMRILSHRRPSYNSFIVVAFLVALALVGVKGLLSGGSISDFVSPPAGAFYPSSPSGSGSPASIPSRSPKTGAFLTLHQ